MEHQLKVHLEHVDWLFTKACFILKAKELRWKPMNRKYPVKSQSYSVGYTDLKKGIITLDIFTPKRRQPKASNGLLRVIAHEIAHIQKPPYIQRYRGKLITRIHYPKFYKQVTKNIEIIKKDKVLKKYFKQ